MADKTMRTTASPAFELLADTTLLLYTTVNNLDLRCPHACQSLILFTTATCKRFFIEINCHYSILY